MFFHVVLTGRDPFPTTSCRTVIPVTHTYTPPVKTVMNERDGDFELFHRLGGVIDDWAPEVPNFGFPEPLLLLGVISVPVETDDAVYSPIDEELDAAGGQVLQFVAIGFAVVRAGGTEEFMAREVENDNFHLSHSPDAVF